MDRRLAEQLTRGPLKGPFRKGFRLLATGAVLTVQIPMTIPCAFSMGIARYARELYRGVVYAFRVARNG